MWNSAESDRDLYHVIRVAVGATRTSLHAIIWVRMDGYSTYGRGMAAVSTIGWPYL